MRSLSSAWRPTWPTKSSMPTALEAAPSTSRLPGFSAAPLIVDPPLKAFYYSFDSFAVRCVFLTPLRDEPMQFGHLALEFTARPRDSGHEQRPGERDYRGCGRDPGGDVHASVPVASTRPMRRARSPTCAAHGLAAI